MAKAEAVARPVAQVTLGAQGRFVIPATFRKALDLVPGAYLLLRIEGEHLVVEKPTTVERRIHARFRTVSQERSLADELIKERRREAAKEAAG